MRIDIQKSTPVMVQLLLLGDGGTSSEADWIRSIEDILRGYGMEDLIGLVMCLTATIDGVLADSLEHSNLNKERFLMRMLDD